MPKIITLHLTKSSHEPIEVNVDYIVTRGMGDQR
jgi:hypothetical protein